MWVKEGEVRHLCHLSHLSRRNTPLPSSFAVTHRYPHLRYANGGTVANTEAEPNDRAAGPPEEVGMRVVRRAVSP